MPSDNENLLRALNPIPYPEYLYLSKSAFLVSLVAPSKELSNTKYIPRENGHKFIS